MGGGGGGGVSSARYAPSTCQFNIACARYTFYSPDTFHSVTVHAYPSVTGLLSALPLSDLEVASCQNC